MGLAEGFDPGILFQAAVVFAIFVLPVLRNIVQSRQKQRGLQEKQRRGEVKAPPDKQAQRKGKSDWERLLRGEQVESGEGPKPPVFLEQLFPELVEEEPPPPVEPKRRPRPRPAPEPTPVRKERAADQSMGVDFEGDLREREPRPELEPALAGLGETDLTALDDTRQPVQRRRRPRAGLDWRRAVALSEVLGPPVSMRESGAWPGAPRGL